MKRLISVLAVFLLTVCAMVAVKGEPFAPSSALSAWVLVHSPTGDLGYVGSVDQLTVTFPYVLLEITPTGDKIFNAGFEAVL